MRESQLLDLVILHDKELVALRDSMPALRGDIENELGRRLKAMSASLTESAHAAVAVKTDIVFREHSSAVRLDLLAHVGVIRNELLNSSELAHASLVVAHESKLAELKPQIVELAKTSAMTIAREYAEKTDHITGLIKREFAAQPSVGTMLVRANKGNWNMETVYGAGEIFAFRGSSYLVLRPNARGEFPNVNNQRGANPVYQILAAAGSPAPPIGSVVTSLTAGPGITLSDSTGTVTVNNPTAASFQNAQRIIIDDDVVSDWDGTIMLSMMNNFADRAECQILAVTVDVSNGSGPQAASACMNYANRANVPIGVLTGRTVNSPAVLVGTALAALPNSIPSGVTVESATTLLRRVLAASPNASVKFLMAGSTANLRLLYESAADSYSNLAGPALIAQKISEVIVMGGTYPTSAGVPEHNFALDPSSNYVLPLLTVQTTFIGHEIGTQSSTAFGSALPANNPQNVANAAYLGTGVATGVWDPLAALYAVRGLAYNGTTYFSKTTGTITVNTSTGDNAWSAGAGTQAYLSLVMSTGTSVTVVKNIATQLPQGAKYAALNGYTSDNSNNTIEGNQVVLAYNATSPSIFLNNVADRATNYERIESLWSSNIGYVRTAIGGSATTRTLRLASANAAGAEGRVDITRNAVPWFSATLSASTGVTGTWFQFGNANTISTASSGTVNFFGLVPIYNQSSSAAATDLLINRTETAVGSGAQFLADFQVGSTSRVNVDNKGIIGMPGSTGRVSTQFDTTSTTLADVTGISVALRAAKSYRFRAVLFTSSNIAGGVKAAVASSGSVTNIIYDGFTYMSGTAVQTRSTTSGGAVGAVTAVTAATIIIEGTITTNAAGNLTVQFAANSATGTSSVLVGSYMTVYGF